MKKALNNKETKELMQKLEDSFGLKFSKKDNFMSDEDIILVNNEAMFFYCQDRIISCLKQILKNNFLKKVVVDMGAVKFVVNGADIMRPGITKIDDGIEKQELITVVDQNYGKPLAVGIALFSSGEMLSMKSGKVVKNVHWIGDRVWNYQA